MGHTSYIDTSQVGQKLKLFSHIVNDFKDSTPGQQAPVNNKKFSVFEFARFSTSLCPCHQKSFSPCHETATFKYLHGMIFLPHSQYILDACVRAPSYLLGSPNDLSRVFINFLFP